MQWYVARKLEGVSPFDCTGCKEEKCLLKGSVEIETYERDESGKRIVEVINNVDEMFDYIDRATAKARALGQDPTELDLTWINSGHRVCPIPLIDIETSQIVQAVSMAREPSPLEIAKLPWFYVQVKSIMDTEASRMERIYGK